METAQPAENQKKNHHQGYSSLNDFRIKNNLSYARLGELWGVPTMTAHSYVSGKIKIPRKDALQRIHQVTGIPIQKIIFQKEIMPKSIYYINEKMRGINNPRWNGGTSEYQNHYLLKKRRIEVLRTAKGKCEICGDHAGVIHHVDENKSNQEKSNLMPLCKKCHWAIHTKDARGTKRQNKTSKFIRTFGMSAKKIAEHFNVSIGTVRHCLKCGLNPPLVKRDSVLNDLREKIKKFIMEHHQ